MSDKSHDTVLATEQQDIYSIEDLLPVILFNCQQLFPKANLEKITQTLTEYYAHKRFATDELRDFIDRGWLQQLCYQDHLGVSLEELQAMLANKAHTSIFNSNS